MDPTTEPAFAFLYDEARAAIVEGYQKADEAVLSFAIEHELTTDEVWRLVGDEASVHGDDAVEYLAQHPPEDSTWSPGVAGSLVMLGAAAFIRAAARAYRRRQ